MYRELQLRQLPISLKFIHSVWQAGKAAKGEWNTRCEILFFLLDFYVSLKWQDNAPETLPKALIFLMRADNSKQGHQQRRKPRIQSAHQVGRWQLQYMSLCSGNWTKRLHLTHWVTTYLRASRNSERKIRNPRKKLDMKARKLFHNKEEWSLS